MASGRGGIEESHRDHDGDPRPRPVIDDDRNIRQALAEYLRRRGFRASVAEEASAMDRVLATSTVDLIVLDVMMPGEDGFAICRRLQETTPIPVILLTALTEEADRIVGLELGADDYVTKPFNPRELVARINAVLRRSRMLPPRRPRPRGLVEFDRWRFDLSRREVLGPDDVAVRLSAGEHLLLISFIEYAGLTDQPAASQAGGRSGQPADPDRVGRRVRVRRRGRVARMKAFRRLVPRTMAGQMLAILGLSFALLLAVLAALEVLDQEDVVEWAQSEATLARLRRMKPAVELMSPERVDDFLAVTSSCHVGYALTSAPFPGLEPSAATDAAAERIARALAMDRDKVRVGRVQLGRDDFSYRDCGAEAVELPTTGVVISMGLRSGRWFHAEVHPHEWHVRRDMSAWVTRSIGAFLFVGAIAVFSVRRLIRPLDELTGAANEFGKGLEVSEVREAGPPDLRRAIRSFNLMQRQVTDEVARRTHTLMAISHDLRTPLTALRISAEPVDEVGARRDLVASIDAMERITASALQFLRGECQTEPVRTIDLRALVESECSDFEELGWNVTFAGERSFHYRCRPDALARALRCLIDNAVRHGGGAEVALRPGPDGVVIAVSDHGPGIPPEKLALALEPFERLSPARESGQGGFGLGLAIVRAIVEGHQGALVLEANHPTGLIATIRLPVGGLP